VTPRHPHPPADPRPCARCHQPALLSGAGECAKCSADQARAELARRAAARDAARRALD